MRNRDMATQSTEHENTVPNKKPKMKWYNFIIYFQLFCIALSFVVIGIIYVSGMAYSATVYELYHGLRVTDIFFGIMWFGFAVFALIVRYRLANFRKNAAVCLHALYIGIFVAQLLCLVTAICVTGGDDMRDLFTVLGFLLLGVGCVVMIVLNYIYFKKRKCWFVGSPYLYNQASDGHKYVADSHKGDDWWFAYLIYFALFVGAAADLAVGLYWIIYFAFSHMPLLDLYVYLVYGILCLGFAAFQIATRILLGRFKRSGVICLHVCFCLSVGIRLLLVVFEIALSSMYDVNVVSGLDIFEFLYITAVTIGNFVYFKNRKHIFC